MAVDVIATYTGSSNDGGTGPTVTVVNVVAGDWLVACFGDGYGSATMTVTDSLSGAWNGIGTAQGSPNDPNFKNYRCHAQYRVISADASNINVTYQIANSRQLVVLHLRGAGAVQDFSETALTQSGGGPAATQALAAVDGTADGLLVGMWGGVQFTTGTWSWSTPSGMTERADIRSPEGFTSLAVSTQALTATADTGTRSSTATQAPANGFAGKLFSITAAAVVNPGVPYLTEDLGDDTRLLVEFAYGADLHGSTAGWVWTDQTELVYQSSLNVTLGRGDEASRSQPATCSFTVDNTSGYFSLGGQNPQWPNIRRNTPVRASMRLDDTDYVLFQGFADGFTPGWDAMGRIPTVQVSASGTLRRLAQGDAPIQSAYRRAMINTSSVVAYWPFEEQRGATFADNYRGGSPMIISGEPSFGSSSDFNCSAPLPTLGTGRFEGIVSPYASTGENQVRFLIKIPDDGLTDGTVLAYIYTTGSILRWDIVYSVGGTGNLSLYIYNNDTSLNSSTVNMGFDMNGNNRRLSLEMVQNGGNIDWQIGVIQDDPHDPGGYFDDTITGKTVGVVSEIAVAPNGDCGSTVFGHLTVQDEQTSLFEANGPLLAYVGEFPSSGNTAISRLHRLCSENMINLERYTGNNLPVADNLIANADEMGPQLVAPLLTLLNEIEVCDQGQLWDGRSAGLSYTTRRYRDDGDVALAIDCASGELFAPFQAIDDDQRNRNKVSASITRGVVSTFEDSTGPLGTDAIGIYDDAITVNNQNDSMGVQYAAWAVSLGTVEGYRYPTVSLNMRELPDQAAAVLAIIPGDRITLTNLEDVLAHFQSGPVSLIVEGISHSLSGDEWVVTFQCSLFAPWSIARVAAETGDTSEFVFRADTDGSSLSASYTNGVTSISVATPSGPLWTTASDDYPMSLDVGGIEVVASACSGTSSPQTFTVTALPLARTAGLPVKLWHQNPLGL